MSRVERIVTSLEVSIKLRDLGILQESCFYWVLDGPRGWGVWMKVDRDGYHNWFNVKEFSMPMNWEPEEPISAWTPAELWGMMGSADTPDSEFLGALDIKLLREKHPVTNGYPDSILTKIIIKEMNQNLEKWIKG
jgi:hypothetical protein